MERFHEIEDAAAILRLKNGVHKQVKVYVRGVDVYAAHGGGFIRLYRTGTSLPGVSLEGVDLGDREPLFDRLGRMSVGFAPLAAE